MTYRIYTTDGFIIKNSPTKDADVQLLVFTEQFGLLYAHAKSARALLSKLKASLQTTSFSSISMVKGREIWRITNSKKHISLYDKRLPIELRTLCVRLLAYIERFCPKEMPEPGVFMDLKQIASFIFIEAKKLDSVQLVQSVETWFLLRMLHHLGYIKDEDFVHEYLSEDVSIDQIKTLSTKREEGKSIDKILEYAIAQSHL